VVRKSEQANAEQALVTLSPGQLVVIGMKAPPGGFAPESEVIHASMQDTNVNPHVFIAHPKIWIPILAGVAGGLATGLVLTYGGGSSATTPPPAVCDAAPRVRSQATCQK